MDELKILVEQARAWLSERERWARVVGNSGPPRQEPSHAHLPPWLEGLVGFATWFLPRYNETLRLLVLGAISFPEVPCVSHALLQKNVFTLLIRCYFDLDRQETCPTTVLHLIMYSASDYWMLAKCQALFWT